MLNSLLFNHGPLAYTIIHTAQSIHHTHTHTYTYTYTGRRRGEAEISVRW